MSAAPEPPLVLSRADFEALPNYSCSVPTGTTIGKRWRRGVPYREPVVWFLGEYYELPEGERFDRRGEPLIGIRWRRITVLG